jgi:hypothetical protein
MNNLDTPEPELHNAKPARSVSGNPIIVSGCCGSMLEGIPGGVLSPSWATHQCSKCGRVARAPKEEVPNG